MGQIIPATSGENAQNKGLEFAGLFKMTGSSIDKIRNANDQSAKDEDVNNLVPFLHFLNQQMSQADKHSDCDNTAKINIGLEQALSRETAGIDEEQKGQKDISVHNLLNEMNRLNNKTDTGVINHLFSASVEQVNNQEEVLSKGNAADALSAITGKKPESEKSNEKNESATLNNQNAALNQPGLMTLETVKNNFLQGDQSSEEAQIEIMKMESTNTAANKFDAVKADNANFQSRLEKEAADSETAFNMQNKDKESAINDSEKTVKQQMMNYLENPDQLAEKVFDKINLDSSKTFKENSISQAVPPEDAKNEDSESGTKISSSMPEIKESQMGKEKSIHFAEKQQRPDTTNPASGNKFQAEKVQVVAREVSGIKFEQKGKNIANEKGREEVPLGSVNTFAGNYAGNERINDVSADKLVGQITGEIKEAAVNEGGRIKITLDPPSLGRLEMDVTVRNGKVDVVLVADNKDVQQTLNIHIDKLKGGLQNQGLTIDRCDVFMQDNRGEYQQNFSRQTFYQESGSRQNGNNQQNKPEEKVPAGATISMRSGTVSGISTDNISLFA